MLMALGVGFLGLTAHALFGEKAGEDKAAAAKKDVEIVAAETDAESAVEKEVESKLLKLTTLEDAFLKAVRTRNALQRYVVQERNALPGLEEEEAKKAAQERIEAARKRLRALSIAMDVVFGVGQRRDYDYDPVKSTVYLKVGTVEDAFTRAIRTRDALRDFVVKNQALKEAEKDEEKKTEIEARLGNATRQYQTIVAALQLVYGVTPQRNYLYNPTNSTLYLRVSEAELEKLKADLQKLQDERAAKEESAEKEAAAKKE